jgi:uncharacterized membrane protein YkvA (DUF1232 family)
MGFINRIIDWVTTPYTIYLIIKDPTIPRAVKIRAGVGLAVIFAYAVSPFDIIPDVVPLAGWLDDLIIVPLGFVLLRKITPGIDIVEKKSKAQRSVRRIVYLAVFSLAAAVLLSLAWLGLIIYFIVRLITH